MSLHDVDDDDDGSMMDPMMMMMMIQSHGARWCRWMEEGAQELRRRFTVTGG
jgi:hypothetical protein